MYSVRLPLLALWVAVVTAGRVITLTYDPAFDAAMPNLNFGPNTATAQLDLIRSNRSNIDDIDFHLSPFIIPAPILTSGNYTNKPVAIVSMCLASSVGNSTGLSLKQIGAAMSGTPSAATASILWYIAPATVSPSSASLLQALVLNGIAPFTSTTAWPAAVLTNPNVQLVPDGASVSAALNNCPPSVWCIGPQLNFAAWASAKQCLRIRRTVTVTGDTISYSNRLTEATAPFTIVEPQNSTAYSQGPVYPFIGGVYLSTRLGVPCDVMDALTDMLVTFFTNATNHAALDALGMQSLGITDSYATLNLLQPMSETNCSSNVFTASVKGDSNLYDAFANLNFDAFTNKNFEYMVSLNSGTTAAVLADLYDPETLSHAAFVEGAPNVTLRATKPSIVTGPLFAHGLAVVYSLDGRDDLVASPCTMLGIMNGTIQYWDDPALTADNLGIQLPHLKITRVMPAEGSQEAAGRGVSYIARRCGVNLVTSYTRFPFKSDVQGLASSQVVPQVQIIPGAIGLAPTSSAFDASMQRLAIRFPSKLQLSGSMDDITSTIAQSTINLTTNAVKFPARTVDYFPFVAIVYAVVDTDAQGGCDAYTRTLQWLIYVAGQSAETVLTNANHVVLSDTMRALVAAAIAQTKCDGIILFPLPVTPILWWPYAVAAAVVLALIAVIVVRMGNQFWLMRVRPTDPTKPIAVMFVGIKNQAAVMEAGEENAAAVFRCVADMVRRMVREHGCYEARRIDAATTMIVAKDAKSAAACAEDVVLALSQDVAWLDAVMTYPMPEQSKLPRQRHSSLHPSKKTPRSARNRKASTMLTSRTISDPNMHRTTSDINATMASEVATTPLSQTSSNEQHAHTGSSGLTLQKCVPEIYAGVHWTHVMIEARDTTVSYHGAGITTAACIADLAVGGQIIVSRELMDQLSIETADDDKGMWYGFAAVGDGSSSDHLVGMSLTTPRFPEWLIARSALRRKSLEEKDSHDGNMIAAAMASADGALGKRRIAAVSMLVQDLVNEGADGRAAVVGETLTELLDIVTSNRGQIHSITDGVVTVTVGAGAPVAMASVRAAQIAMQASDLCAAIGVHSGSAMVGNAMGGKPATVGRVVAGAALMRVVAARAGVRVCATDVAKSELAAKFELATVDLVAVPWDLVKTFRCLCLAEERTQSEEGEWLYDMADGFAVFERRLDGCLSTQISVEDEPDVEQGALKTEPRSALLDRHADICSASNELYRTLLSARNGCFVKELATSRLSSLGSFAFLGGPRATVL